MSKFCSLSARCLSLILFFAIQLPAQSPPAPEKSIFVKKTDGEIRIDGILDEATWNRGNTLSDFWQYFPLDSAMANARTEVTMLYDDQFLYVGVKSYTTGDNYITQSLRRDYSYAGNDNVTLVFDTYNDANTAFAFGMNAFGVRREALISNGGRQRQDFSSSWDNKWFGEVKTFSNYWIAEFAIPFNTLRFAPGSTQWRFNCYRNDTQINEQSVWARHPRNLIIMDLSFMGDLIWESPPKRSGSNFSVIPYMSGSTVRDFEDETQTEADLTSGFGGDAKIGITSGLNLDLTFNPDFSQVEVDQQQTNLDRFELFFPERRQFFLENADLFAGYGLGNRASPFFSRRIGIAIDTATGQNIQNPILYGARLSGKINEDFRIGLINMQTAKELDNGLPSYNYTVASLQHQVFSRSNVSFIFVNKQAMNSNEFSPGTFSEFNRVAGLEYRLATPENRWSGKVFYHRSFSPVQEDHAFTHGLQLEYLKKKYRLEWAHVGVGNGYNAETGFVPRKDYWLWSPELQLFFYPKSGPVNIHDINIDSRFFWQIGKDENPYISDYQMSEWQVEAQWSFQFKDNSRATITATQSYLTLLSDFDPTRVQEEDVFLPAGSSYSYLNGGFNFSSNPLKNFVYEVEPIFGQFANGSIAGIKGAFTYRLMQYGSLAMTYDYNYIKLKAPFKPASIWLVGPKVDLTFTRNLFLTGFFQYNTQLDNVNINTRLQWRFAPVSDFFIVYTNNYLVEGQFSQFAVRNRALVAKLTYWLNL